MRVNGEEAFLLFVDRPCRIQAPAGNRRRMFFDARIPHAGVHAIQTRYLEDGKQYALIQPTPRELDVVAPALGLSAARAAVSHRIREEPDYCAVEACDSRG